MANFLKETRKTLRYSQAQFAQLLGTTMSNYQAYESKRHKVPDEVKIKLFRLRGTKEDLELADELEKITNLFK
jgi:transcriptional regulator with XRE-family HTH domain